ncbi:MAG TPA: amino acid adenylation domain-containing protein [Bacillota bacterium]|nr:amino acid adenylation domain-containing protein [Bacillota bacterium]
MNQFKQRLDSLSPEKRRLLESQLKSKGLQSLNTGYQPIEPVPQCDHYPPGYYPLGYYPTSSAQKRLFIIGQFEKTGISYNIPMVMIIAGNLDLAKFDAAFHKLIKRHEAFRTSFELADGEPVQIIHQNVEFTISQLELEEKQVKQAIQEFIKPFDLKTAPLIRVLLIKLGKNKHLLITDMHHIISDGISSNILMKEFAALYQGESLPELRIQYKDFAGWQNDLLKSETLKLQKEYWLNQFSGEIPVLDLPADFPRPSVQSFEGDRISFVFERQLTEALNQLSLETGATLFMLILSAYNILLSKYTGQTDVVVGSPIAGRNHPDLENIVGMFVNSLALRNAPEGKKRFVDFLGEVKENSLKAFENQDYQFEDLVEKLAIPRDVSRNPIFDTMFGLQDSRDTVIEAGNLQFTPYEFENKTAKFDLTFNAVANESGLEFILEYSTGLFTRDTVERFAGHFRNIVTKIIENPNRRLMDIDILSEAEKEQLLFQFNHTFTEYPRQKTIPQIFEEQAAKTPDQIALIYEDKRLTYAQLNDCSNRLARVLREKGAHPNECIGLLAERSLEMIIGILAIQKAGSAYLPLDPGFPEDRLRYMLEDCDANLLLAQVHLQNRIKFRGEAIPLEADVFGRGDGSNLAPANAATDLAYVIYTSGSTGKPKGNLTTHHNIIRVVKDTNYIDVMDSDVLLQLSNYAFDGSTFDIFGALLNGASLVLISKDTMLDLVKLTTIIEEQGITMFFVTTALFNTLVDLNISCFQKVRKVLFGGERVSPAHTEKALAYLGLNRIIHVYGPTESTVYATYYFVNEINKKRGTVPIGKPISNTQVYILDRNLNLTPIGAPGELCISGDGLARGYMNNPELTAEKFVPNPFIGGSDGIPVEIAPPMEGIHETSLQESPQRIYRTGDLVRWLPDGNIEFLGRIDHQVKIRGYRIELGEIETRLLNHPSVKEAIIIVKEEQSSANMAGAISAARESKSGAIGGANGEGAGVSGAKYLCAYFVAEQELSVPELREYLAQDLPDYMIPAFLIQLEKMPLTPNGKINQKALPEPAENVDSGVPYVAPRNESETKLVRIWQEVLKIEKIGVHDEFFVLGGDSLKALKAATEAVNQNVPISISDIFKYKTIANIIENMAATPQEPSAAIKPEPDQQTDTVPDIIKIENKWAPFVLYRRDDPEIKELTVEIQRDITIYLHRALPLCVVLADPNLHPWYYEHFINIFSATDSQGFLTLDYLEIHAPYRDVIGEIALGAKQMERETDIIQYLREQINQGFYLNIVVDEFYLPGKARYHKTHYVHHVLVYGYDNVKQKVKGLGFNNGGVFAELIFSYQAFAEAYEKGKQFYQDSAPWAFRTAVQLFYNNGFSSPHPFRIDKFLTELHNYLYSIGDEGLIYYWRLKQEEVAYGLGVYELVLRHLQNLLQGKMTTDYRAIHLLAEHKKGIAKRLHYIINRYHISDLLLEPYQKYLGVVDQFNDIRLKFFDLQYDLNAGRIKNSGKKLTMALEQLMARIGSVREKERMILSEIYEILKSLSPETMSPAEVIISNNHETTNNR